MNIRNIVVVGALAIFGALAFWDYNSADSRKARELHDLEKLAPDVQIPSCYPEHPRAKVFAEVVYADKRDADSLLTEQIRKGALTHDCIRGADNRANVEHLADVLGDDAIPLYAAVLEKCKVDKLDVSPSACFAMDALAKLKTPKATAALEQVLTSRKQIKDVWLGALYRLMQVPNWKTRSQLAEMVPQEKAWEAKELLIEKIREVRDASAKPALQKAFETETDPQEKGKLHAAILEIDNPGKCVAEDSGEGANGVCRYVCKDQNTRVQSAKIPADQPCPLVRDPSAQTPEVAGAQAPAATSNVAGASK